MNPTVEYVLVGLIVLVAAVLFVYFKVQSHRKRKNTSCSGLCENCPQHSPECGENEKDVTEESDREG